MSQALYIGQRLCFSKDLCTVRYIGPVDGTKGEWLGVEWDDASRGKHDGQANGTRYFECLSREPTAASFVRPNRIRDPTRSFLESLHYKYAPESIDLAFAVGDKNTDVPIVISGKEVEEVGFDKIRKQLAELGELRIVILDDLCMRGTLNPDENDESIGKTCPKITELDLSRNLFEDWRELVPIVGSLKVLRSLKLDGNRFQDLELTVTDQDRLRSALRNIDELSLSSTLLPWDTIVQIGSLCNNLKRLTLATNEFRTLSVGQNTSTLPQSLTQIFLEWNEFTALSDLRPLTALPNLAKLMLKENKISRISRLADDEPLRFASTLAELDLSCNEINSWSFIDQLSTVFPGLQSLRVSRNPLFDNLTNIETQRPLTATDGYMLTLARLPDLRVLNYSTVNAKDRQNGEAFYLGQIAAELRRTPVEQESGILARHPRWRALCDEYGEPEIVRIGAGTIDPNSLQARLVTCNFSLALDRTAVGGGKGQTQQWMIGIPASLSMYAVLGLVGKKLGLSPGDLKLVWETGEKELIGRGGLTGFANDDDSNLSWDSEEDEGGSAAELSVEDVKMREVEMVAGTRSLGTWVDGVNVKIRAERVGS